MKKNFLIGLIVVLNFSTLYGVDIISAHEASKITKQNTQKLKDKLLTSKNGKKAYELLTKMIDKGIKKVANKGYYNVLNINVLNSETEINKIRKLLSSDREFEILKEMVINALIQKGYKVSKGELDHLGSMHLLISWSKE